MSDALLWPTIIEVPCLGPVLVCVCILVSALVVILLMVFIVFMVLIVLAVLILRRLTSLGQSPESPFEC